MDMVEIILGELHDLELGPEPEESDAESIIKALQEAGYAIVPVEPTEAMIDAGDIHFCEGPQDIWEAMIQSGAHNAE